MRRAYYIARPRARAAASYLGDAPPDLLQLLYSKADQYGIDRKIAYWQITKESQFNPKAYNKSSGAKGLGQFTAATWTDYGKGKDIYNPEANLDAWGRYMQKLLRDFGGDYSLALAGYNSGPGNVIKYGRKVPPFKETIDYVNFITSNAGAGLTPSAPPVLASAPAPVPTSPTQPTRAASGAGLGSGVALLLGAAVVVGLFLSD